MQPGTLRSLEFDRVVEAVRAFALTPMGDECLSRVAPSIDHEKVVALLAATTETVAYIERHGVFPLRSAAELPQILTSLAVEGRALEPLRLLTLAAFLESVEESRAAIRRLASSFPILDRASTPVASFKGEITHTRAKIDQSGEVADDASPELRSIRDRLRKQRTRLRGTLESYLRGKDTAKYLQEQVVTERGGRYVLVVRAEHRSNIPGIVHGASTSGASLFLEPLSTVEINNDIVALDEQEAEEVRKILLALADAFRARAGDLTRTIDAAADLDVLQARARYSQSIHGVAPALSTDGRFELQAARHPLLKSPVPVTIKIIPPATSLLVTGPNTGGKTVALKTAGLLVLMAQSGLWIPAAEGSRLPVFRSVFADIGDEQSIEASLSTFSAHVSNLAAMDTSLAVPALVMLDEVGSGTDPIEGGALGVAVVDHFRRRGATVIATSHYDALKSYASTTAGVASAAFGFDADTFAPTYQLIYGTPGRSLALEIAARLGLNQSVIAAARQNLTARETQLAEHLAKIDRDMRSLEHQHRLATREREALSDAEGRMRQREDALKQREETFKRRLNDAVETEVRQARREIDDVIAALKSKGEAIARDASKQHVSTGDTGTARSDARAAVDAVARRVLEASSDGEARTGSESAAQPVANQVAAAVGDKVMVGAFGLEGVVTSVHDGHAEIDVRGKRMRAALRDLRVVGLARASKREQGAGTGEPSRVRVNVTLQPREGGVSAELNVIGCTVDEALTRAERFLDDTLLGDARVVRVIHGYGTGQLKRAIAEFLQQHPLVVKFDNAPPNQGGGGVTVVELKD
ncbi:MAG TPA: endonuclease MutS2 [Vicinamibacterales bacterium]|jgi:DNA mismatch repair protein MutS2|nr:endonuclease MutS2 [Vicinamibacterales bacterium]